MSNFQKIVIFGQYKSGSTALFHRIRNSLPANCRELFEQSTYKLEPEDKQKYVLAKTILGIPTESFTVDYDSFQSFDKKLYLVRDPRDWVISGTLFITQQEPKIYKDSVCVQEVLNLLIQKEQDPSSISVTALLDAILTMAGQTSLAQTKVWLESQFRWLDTFEDNLGAHLKVKYEEFVDDRIGELANYLGLRISENRQVPSKHDHVIRTKSHGNWRHWFLEEDIEFFRKPFARYLQRHNYDHSWELATEPEINPAHCSEYVKRVTIRAQGN